MTKGQSCILTFEPASGGALFLNWRHEQGGSGGAEGERATVGREGKGSEGDDNQEHMVQQQVVATATSFSRPLPSWKTRRNGGREELLRGMSGGVGSRLARYFAGICQFIKIAQRHGGEFTILKDEDKKACTEGGGENASHVNLPPVDIFLLLHTKKVMSVPLGSAVSPSVLFGAIAVAVVPRGNKALLGLREVTKDYFLGTGHREGAAVAL